MAAGEGEGAMDDVEAKFREATVDVLDWDPEEATDWQDPWPSDLLAMYRAGHEAGTERAAGLADRDGEDDCPCGDEIAAAIREKP